MVKNLEFRNFLCYNFFEVIKAMKKIITIEGMHCEHCKGRVETALKGMEEIKNAKVDLNKKTATVSLKEEVSDDKLFETVKAIGFEPIKIEIKKGLF